MAAAKKRKSKTKPRRAPGGAVPAVQAEPDMMAPEDESDLPMQPFGMDNPISIDIPNDDGTVTISFPSEEEPKRDSKFDDNLADLIDDIELGRIANELLEAIEQDEHDRAEWIQQRADGLDLLGNKIERPGGGNVGTSSTAVPGQSTVRDGILGDACERFRANAFAELCPSEGPCKVENFGKETADTDGLAEEFEKDMNYFLTTTAREYYPDTNKMLWWTGYASGMFKKVYRCPLRNRPVSESVDGADLIVPSNATDLHNAGRITHQINMRQSTMKRMQILGVYRNVALTAPTPQPNVLQNKEADIVGMNANQQREQDQQYTIYECYCERDIPGFEHKQNGEPSGLPLPYRVTLDKDSRVILEIRRNWNQIQAKPQVEGAEEDESEDNQLPTAKIPFVLFAYSLGLGFYGTGLLHKLGNYAMALTSMLRISIDSGMFSNFPGFLYAKPMGRQLQNEFRVPPGGGAPIDVSAVGGNINNAVMALPYKPVDQGFVALQSQTRENASRIGGTAEAPTGEGVMNAPVGSVLAAIDQATRVEGGVHKMLYAAQKEELELLKELFRDDPEALWRGNKRPAMGADHATRLARFKLALENCDLVPASDPNVPSHMHRMAKATTLLQTAMALPGAFKMPDTLTKWGAMVRIDDIQNLLAPPQQPQPDPIAEATLALKAREIQVKENALALKAQTDQAQLHSKENIEALKVASQHASASYGTPQPDPKQRVAESLNYKDAPPDVQRQIEMQAGLQPSQIQPVDPSQAPADPLQEAALQLKQQQVHQSGIKMAIDAHNSHADRQSKETVKAMDIATRLATHPESQPVVNSELQGLSAFMTPTQKPDGMSEGGPVQTAKENPEHTEAKEAVDLAMKLAEALKQYSQHPPSNRWWN